MKLKAWKFSIGDPKVILFLLWLLLNTFLLVHRGIYLKGESAKYLFQAHTFLATGAPAPSNLWYYIIEILLVAFCIKFHLSFFLVVFIQLGFNLIATAFFYKTLAYLFGDIRIAFVGTLLLLANYYYQEFNTFLYTESLFYSFTLILTCYLIRIQTLSIKNVLTVAGMSLIICVTRPTGLLFLPPVFLYLFLMFCQKMSILKKLTWLTGLTIIFLFLINRALDARGLWDFMLPFRFEMVICDLPSTPTPQPIQTTANGNSLYGLFYYILHNFSQFFRLFRLRTWSFFGIYRSYFSVSHNIYLLVFFNSMYILTLASLGYWIRKKPNIFSYLILVIILAWATVVLSCDDWHNRFFLAISPFFIILAMPALLKLRKPIFPSDTSSHTRY